MQFAASSTKGPLRGIFARAVPETEQTARACQVQSLGELMPLVVARYWGVDPSAENAPPAEKHAVRAMAG